MAKAKNKPVSENKEALLSEIEALKNHIRRLEIEKDILEKATDLLKKDLGIELKSLKSKEKTRIIDALNQEYSVAELLPYLHLPRSSYYYHHRS